MDIKGKEGAEAPLPNLNGGHSLRADFKEIEVVVEPLVRDNEGLIREDLLRLTSKSDRYSSLSHKSLIAHSGCFGGSVGDSCIASSVKVDVTSSIGDVSGVGSTWVVTMKGALWGNGDISIESFAGPGEEDGSGGVLAPPVPY